MKRLFAVVAIAIVLLLSLAAPALAATVVSDSYEPGAYPPDFWMVYSTNSHFAQTFTAGEGGNLDSATMWMAYQMVPGSGPMYAELYAVTGTWDTASCVPTGSPLATSHAIDASVITSHGGGAEPVTFTFTSPVALTAGRHYAIALRYEGIAIMYLKCNNPTVSPTAPTHPGSACLVSSGVWRECTALGYPSIDNYFAVYVVAHDTAPDPFSFTSKTKVTLSTTVQSGTVTIDGIDAPAPISVSNGQYRINGGAWTSASGTISDGQTVAVRHVSSGTYSTVAKTTLTIGGVSGTFSSTTVPAPPKVASIGPSSGPTSGGTLVTIQGSYFSSVSSVTFGGVAATSVTVSGSKITCKAPARVSGTVDVKVTAAGGTSSASGTANDYTYAVTRYQESSTLLSYATGWTTSAYSANYSGGYMKTRSSSAPLTFTFKGVGFKVIAGKGPGYGKLKVSIDGVVQSIYPDLYSASRLYHQTVYAKSGLTNGTHTVVLDYSGQKNTRATARTVNLDALDIDGTLAAACTRYQETDSRIHYSAPWTQHYSTAYSQSYMRTRASLGALTVKFTGTGFRVICAKGKNYGKLKITIDGTALTTSLFPDLYSASALYRVVAFTKTGMSYGLHTVILNYSGLKNTNSSGAAVNLDAVDVYGTLSQAQ